MQEDLPVSNRTRFIFALVGIFACLAGALCAELAFQPMRAASLLRRYHAASLLFITDPEITYQTIHPEAPPPDDTELQRRLDQAGATSGDVQISLAWNNNNDLDLSCIDPNGEMIDGYNQTSRSGGVLDVDMNVTPGNLLSPAAEIKIQNREEHRNLNHRTAMSSEPVENLVWTQNAPVGHYKVFVHQFCNKERTAETPWWLVVRVHGQIHRITGSCGREDFADNLVDPKMVYEFDVAPAKAVNAPAAPVRRTPPPPPPPDRVVPHRAYSLKHLDYVLLTSGLWGALLGLLPIALLYGQRSYLRRPLWHGEQDPIVGVGGPAAGFMAAIVGQLALSLLSAVFAPSAYPALCVFGWILAGGLFGWLLSLFTPNLPRLASPVAGALSVFAGSILFLLLAAARLDAGGRLLAACLIGGAIGALIALPEREPLPEPEAEPAPPAPRPSYEIQPPFVVRGTRTGKVGGLRQTDRGMDK